MRFKIVTYRLTKGGRLMAGLDYSPAFPDAQRAARYWALSEDHAEILDRTTGQSWLVDESGSCKEIAAEVQGVLAL